MPARKRRAGRATKKGGLRRPPLAGALACRHSTCGFRQPDFRPEGSASGQASRKRRQTLRTCRRRRLGHSDAPRTPVLVPAGMMPEPPGCGPYLSARGRRTRSAAGEYPPRWRPLKSEIDRRYCHRFWQVKGVENYADESAPDEARVLFGRRGTPMIRSSFRHGRAEAPTGKRAFTRGTRCCPKWPA
jgi:hypothetical protein